MTEQEKIQSTVEQNVNAAAEQASKTVKSVATLGRQVTGVWLGVSRTAIEAAAKTLTTTSEMISSLAESMGELSDRVGGASKKA